MNIAIVTAPVEAVILAREGFLTGLSFLIRNSRKRGNMPALLTSEVTSRRNAEHVILRLLAEHHGGRGGLAIGDVLRRTRNEASVDEGTARRAVLELAANHLAVLDSMLNVSLAD